MNPSNQKNQPAQAADTDAQAADPAEAVEPAKLELEDLEAVTGGAVQCVLENIKKNAKKG